MSANNAAAPEVAPEAAPEAAPVFYKISTADGTVFRVEKECMKLSQTLMDCTMNLCYDDDNAEEKDPIPLSNVSKEIFELVHTYMKQHKGEEPEAEPKKVAINEWDAQFLEAAKDQLFDLICAANFLDVKGLLNVTCMTVALQIKGKSPEELRELFDIKTDEEDAAEAARAAKAAAAGAKCIID